jgi:hypothetical protein
MPSESCDEASKAQFPATRNALGQREPGRCLTLYGRHPTSLSWGHPVYVTLRTWQTSLQSVPWSPRNCKVISALIHTGGAPFRSYSAFRTQCRLWMKNSSGFSKTTLLITDSVAAAGCGASLG